MDKYIYSPVVNEYDHMIKHFGRNAYVADLIAIHAHDRLFGVLNAIKFANDLAIEVSDDPRTSHRYHAAIAAKATYERNTRYYASVDNDYWPEYDSRTFGNVSQPTDDASNDLSWLSEPTSSDQPQAIDIETAEHEIDETQGHYIALAGLHGCMPNYCEAFDTESDAIHALLDLHELSSRSVYAMELRHNGYTELRLHKHGNEYAEVTFCDCDDPDQHSDN